MNISPVRTLASGLVLPGAAAARSYAIAPGASSTSAAEPNPSVSPQAKSAQYATRSLGIEDLSALVAEAEVRARTIELFGRGSSGTQSSSWVTLNAESGLDAWGMSDTFSPSLFGTETEADATAADSWRMTEPADQNGDGFVSLTEEFAYARTHSASGRGL